MSTTTTSRTVRSHAPPKPLPPAAVAEFLTTVLPDASPQHRQAVFDDAVDTEGGFEAAVAHFKHIHDVVASGVVIGAPSPPPNAEVKSVDVGAFTIFYHSTYPRHLQENNPFMWNFYIGWRGRGRHSIMLNLAQQGIVVRIPGLTGKWEECQMLTILPSTRVRLSYYDTPGRQRTLELVFPPDPRESSITVHYL